MFTNYQYFLALAEECNISKAADKCFITHQNMSKFLSNLEKEYGVRLFERKPVFSLTPAGKLMYHTLRQIELSEKNLRDQYQDMRDDKSGEILFGTTEGRFRILVPDILSKFKAAFPEVRLRVVSAASPDLRKMVLNNQLDFMVAGVPEKIPHSLTFTEVLQERLYLVISDQMLAEYLPQLYPQCKEELQAGADLRLFQKVPFALNLPDYNSSKLLEHHLHELGLTLNCIHTSSHPDLHHLMSARDYAASFCLTMYLPEVLKLNRETGNKLNIFPILGLTQTNPVAISYASNRVFSRSGKAFLSMLRQQCRHFTEYDLK